MRICVISCWFPSAVNRGSGSFVAQDVAALARGHDVRVVHLVEPTLHDGLEHTTSGGVPVIRVPMRTRNKGDILRAAWQLHGLVRGSDIIHTMASPSLVPFRLMGPLGAPLVHTEHWSGIIRMRQRHMTTRNILAVRAIYHRPRVIAAVSSYLGEALSSLTRREVRTIPNIVDVSGPLARREPDGRIRMVSIGSINAVKDPDLAVRTLAELRARGRDATLTWAGSGPLAEETREEAKRLGVDEHLSLPGYIPPAELPRILRDSDLLLHTSTVETFSLVAAEALGAARPVVIQPEGGHRDFAREPWAQFPAERTPHAYADAVERAITIDDDDGFTSFAEELATTYSEEAFLDRWTRVYEEIAR